MKHTKNERGNASIYVIWLTFILGLMLILIVNMAKIFLVNQQASIGTEQASIAATDIVFDAVREAITDYDEYIEDKFYETAEEGEVFPIEWTLHYQIGEEKLSLIGSGYSENEAGIKAIDHIVTSHLPGDDDMLKDYLKEKLDGKISSIQTIVSGMIEKNFGDASDIRITLFKKEIGSLGLSSSYHIEVVSTKEFEGLRFQSVMPTVKQDIEQRGSVLPLTLLKN